MEAVIKAFLTGHPGKVSKKDSKKKPPAASKKDPEKTPLLPSRGYFFFHTILVCVVIISVVPGVGGVHLLRQPGNVWVTWVNKTGRTDFCLSLQSATSPFRTCLIGIPQYPLNSFKGYVTNVIACNDADLASQTACLIKALNTTLPWDPQELDILGSRMIKNGTTRTCVTFGSVCYKENNSRVCHNFDGNFNGTGGAEAELRDFIAKWKSDDLLIRPYVNQSWTMVSPINIESFSISRRYCGFTSNETRYYRGDLPDLSNWCGSKRGKWSAGYSNGTKCSSNTTGCGGNCTTEWNYYAYGFTFGEQPEVLWNNGTAKALPPGIFLICGDRAWQGIPRNALGGPCYLGQLTMLSPNFTTWITHGPNITGHRRSRRAIRGLSPDCSDEVQLWSATARIFASFFAPGVAAAQALKEIERLACWSVKQANLTSLILNAMLEETNSIRHAVLQNRAAIDFLLLAQGHGCQDVEGMCCFNLSDHSESIHKALQAMKEHTEKIRVEDDPIGDWFTRTFGDLGRWLAKGVKTLLFALLVIVCLLAIIPCIIKCFQDCLSRTMNQFMDERIRYHRIREQL
uniref:Env polyprotein n=1 Tax=Avian leukosis virus TaxID=11864 RepID=A0A1B1RV87_ALV|nr:env protein [Avian leukosis virus]